MYLYFLLALVASASANVYVNSPCPEVQTESNFVFEDFAHGRWYEYARYPNKIEVDDAKCSYADYTLKGDSADLVNYDYVHGKLRSVTGSTKPVPDAVGKLLFTYPYGPNKSQSQHVFHVVGTDNQNYVLGYYCAYDEKKGRRQDFSWVLTRSKTLSPEVAKAVEDHVKSSHFLDKSKYVETDFSTEECKNV